jgi:steroid delta-isomerase-like uncharacterized protein
MDHAATMRRSYDLFNAHDIDTFGELLAEDFVEHEVSPGLAPTRDGVKQFFKMFIAAFFSDLHWDVEDILVDGDKVVGRVTITGTHDGEFMGMPPTGRSFSVQGIDNVRFGADGLGHEHWGVFDVMGMMQQLGAVPEGGSAQ